jgi:AraC-like DNA-binding protein
MKRSLKQLTADAWENPDPAGLTDRQATGLAALACAEIEVLSASHLIQKVRQLVRPGRRLSHTWLYAPLRGTIAVQIGTQRRVVTPNDILLLPAAEPHSAVALTNRFEVVSVHLRICFPGAVHDHAIFRQPVHRLPDPGTWHRGLDTVVSLEHKPDWRHGGVPILRYLLMDLAMHGEPLSPNRSYIDPRIERALKLIREGLETRRSLQDVRQLVGLGASQFHRLFLEATGMPPRAYLKGIRIDGALELLRNPALSIKEIATRLGYYDAQHLEKEFKITFGMTPGRFRLKL